MKILKKLKYFSGGGAYFADDPRKSHDYTGDGINLTRVMFYNKVLLGKESEHKESVKLRAAPKDYHSVRGTKFTYAEYIIYRYGQALPYLKIIYKA